MADLKGRAATWFKLYLELGDEVEAARRAGYTRPGQASSRLMKQDRVKKAIADATKSETIMERDELLQRAATIARGQDIRQSDRYGDSFLGPAPAALQGQMLTMLAKVHGLLREKVEVDMKGSVSIELPDNGRGDRLPDG